jgi:hypothetical protein
MRKSKYHSPKINGLFELLQEASVFSNIYHPSGYYQLKVREKDEKKRVSVRAKAILNCFGHAFWINHSTIGIEVVYSPRIS